MKRVLIPVVILLSVAKGCSRPAPRLEIDSASSMSMGGHIGFTIEGFENYIRRYGASGWKAGLSDRRVLALVNADPETVARRQMQAGQEEYENLVCDAVYQYFTRDELGAGLTPITVHHPRIERDAMIRTALCRLENRGGP